MGDLDFYQSATPSVIVDDATGSRLKPESDGSLPADLTKIVGSIPSSTNPLPSRISDGSVFIDPRQIRALVNTDVVKSQLQDNSGAAITLGQKTKANSLPIVLASDMNLSAHEFNKNGVLFSTIYEWTNVGTSEQNLVHLLNPSGSGKNLIILKIVLSCFDTITSAVYFRIYANPTITGNGTALTISNGRIMTSPTASIANAYRDPTTSAIGTFRFSGITPGGTAGNSLPLQICGGLIIEPNNRLLITAKADGTNRDTAIYIEWGEE
jgi:hypothetical protein